MAGDGHADRGRASGEAAKDRSARSGASPLFEPGDIDDGSTDDSVAEAEYALRKAKVPVKVLFQNNAGPSAARNRGWKTAQGNWIQFLDADDLLHKDKLAIQVREAKNRPKAT